MNEAGSVSDFSFVTVDIVYQPSAPAAYPNVVQEALANGKILSLAESVVNDQKAQIHFAKEIRKFLESLKVVK